MDLKNPRQNSANFSHNNDCVDVSTKNVNKKKWLRIFGAGGLALVMGAGVLFGTLLAPTGATSASNSANLAGAAQLADSAQGLITPSEDDPVLFTTESGLEIKFGNSYSITNGKFLGDIKGGALTSGNLSGFPYFTTNVGSTTYTWVIIGKASNVGSSISGAVSSYNGVQYKILSNWKTTNYSSTNEFVQYYYFFNNIYEETSPAAVALKADNLLSDITAWEAGLNITSIALTSSVKTDAKGEIPAGCVLVIANECIESGVRNTSSAGSYSGGWSGGGSFVRKKFHTTWTGNLKSVMDNYYTNGTLGLVDIRSNIVPVTLNTYGAVGGSSSSTSDFTLKTQSVSNCYIYPLSGTSTDTFYAFNYLTANQAKLSSQWWLRGGNSTSYNWVNDGNRYTYAYSYPYAHLMSTAGAVANSYTNNSAGYRPAFCLKVL